MPIERADFRPVSRRFLNPGAPVQQGQLALNAPPAVAGQLFGVGEAVAKTRQTSDRSVAAPARLKLLDAPVAPLTEAPITKLDPLRRAFDGLAPRTTRADLKLLPGNRDAWLGLWDVLTTAPDGIDASYFILERDIYGMSFLGALLKQTREGQPVRLLVDSTGDYLRMKGFTMPTRGGDYLQELVAHGAEVRIYNPMHKKVLRALLGKVRGYESIANNHDKLVRSSTKAQTGGRNVATDYLSDPGDSDARVYRDTCVAIRSKDTSREMKTAFEREFFQDDVTFKQFKDLLGNWVKRDGELLGAYLMMDSWVNGDLGLTRNDLARLPHEPGFRAQIAERIVARATERFPEVNYTTRPNWRTRRSMHKCATELARLSHLYGTYPAFAAAPAPHQNVEVKVLDRTSAAAHGHDHLTHAIRTAARAAQSSIRIHNPYVTLSEPAIQALEDASRRGVRIDLLTNSPDSSDNKVTQAFFLEDWPRLMARVPTLRIFVLGEGKLHAKSIEVDDRMTFVKSYNLDLLSEKVNSELGIVAWSESLAAEAGNCFDSDLHNPSTKVYEYRIARDEAGKPKLDDRGEPTVTFGAKDHVAPKTWKTYERWRWGVRMLRKLPGMSEYQRPRLTAGDSTRR